ncbi:MAG: hypothetical protein FWF91_06130 [Coriobacteriia bacterium]|nr:hypothetical protein [Coriobacteriia bacterium]
MVERVEDLELCARCGGFCCLHTPGRFSPADFLLTASDRLTESAVDDALDKGFAAVYTSFTNVEGSKMAPIFTLAARGIDRPPLSLCHEPICCAHLKGNRCLYALEERPYECAMMAPAEDFTQCGMPDDMLIEPFWVEYQELLRGVIEKRSGKSWREELLAQLESRWQFDSYAYGAAELIRVIGLAGDSAEADAIIATWLASLV